MTAVPFAIVGGGFRTGYFLRVARALPNLFQAVGMVVRNAEAGRAIEREWGIATYREIDHLLCAQRPEFIVVAVRADDSASVLAGLAKRGVPVLAETPPAADLNGLVKLDELTRGGAKIQVAEQYYLRPMHAARLSIVESGDLGQVTQANVSVSHGYHGVSLLRKLLGVHFEQATIRAMRFVSPMVAGPSRSGPPAEETIVTSPRDIAWIRFGDKLGVYDFTKDQHRSWIRSTHLSVRGSRGEIFDHRVNFLAGHRTPLHLELRRVNRGEEENVEGYFLQGIMLGHRWVYANPYAGARLYDDEIAVATCMENMVRYIRGGPSFYDLRQASQDHYLAMLIEEAIQTGKEVTSGPQPWMQTAPSVEG
ncbi:Gfo/Idh/MocA family protein [Alicyclobacillus fastidiosus]|uniref:Gfo/Idh/MocA family oxidoreductase n=1 Tax=Alicyclobacillus fastidiosus TaxID=392011 RepID=A0ABV5AD95_9BACL|nr:Gfo/Idh/MocA family oxidoreductase [Alicyclobacillus fastidiosus]WEH08802.1 Gfo/Idh/MocA family oxidoreductase [Alicyclobacillus fastidiosus]